MTKEQLLEYFQYLDDLRESGITNMFGAGSYIMREFPNLSKYEAKDIILSWMKTFDGIKTLQQRGDESLQENKS